MRIAFPVTGGDLQTQGLRGGLRLDLGPFEDQYEFLPRIVFENIILRNASWNLKKERISSLVKHKNNADQLLKELGILRDSLQIPQYVLLIEGDNELLINLNNATSIRMLLDIVHKRPEFKLIEFLFGKSGVMTNQSDYFTNQVIISFYKEKEAKNNPNH